jgi:hypothetical protein
MSTIAAGTTSGTALVSTGNTDGTLQLQVNGTTPSVTLAANGSVGVGSSPSYGTSGQVLTSAGTGSAPTWTTIASGLAAASQAEMEAASSNTVAVTPLSTNWHPGVAKVWIKCDASGGILGSYNVTSITDVAVGKVTVTIATDFSSTNYVIVGTSVNGTSECYVCIESTGTGPTDPTVGAFKALNVTAAGGFQDPSAYMLACFGDQ